jgi:hypothetical protein
MREVRCELGEDVEEFVESARTMTDWHYYFERYPWVCIGAAVALGYVVVPKKSSIINLDADAVLELAKKKQLVIKPEKKNPDKRSWRASLVSLMASAALKGAMAYMRHRSTTNSNDNFFATTNGGKKAKA